MKKLTVIMLFWAHPLWGGIIFSTNTAAATTTSNNVTTSAIDTSAANFIVVLMAAGTGTNTLSDSKNNTWTGLTTIGNPQARFFYCSPCIVGTSHTFTDTATAQFPSLAVLAFSGVSASSPFDVENGAVYNAAATVSPGSVTPGQNNEVLIAGLSSDVLTTAMAINSSFIITNTEPFVGGTSFGISAAYKIQTTAGAENPAFSWTTNSDGGCRIATFKAGGSICSPPFCGLLGGQTL